MKSAKSITTPSTALSGIQFSTLKSAEINDPERTEKIFITKMM
jgi:hypothetical protein